MTLPSIGIMNASMINLELGKANSAFFSIGMPSSRSLAGKTTGTISLSDFHGKSSYIREPEEGDIYALANDGIGEDYPQGTLWTFVTNGYGHEFQGVIWYEFIIPKPLTQNTTFIEQGGWRYHRGLHRTTIDGDDWGIYHHFPLLSGQKT